jgi:hypothetical protein
MAATFMTVGFVNAHSPPWTIRTFSYLSVAPDPVGLGQTVFINMFVHMPAPTVNYLAGIDVWRGFTITVTAPDHHQTTLGPFTADATGGTYTTFVPDQLGEYSFEFEFPGQTLTSTASGGLWTGDYFEPSSATATVTVQQEKVQQYPDTPLPTGYWERPIYSMNTEWYRIGGNWLGLSPSTFHTTGLYNASGNFAPYTTAPNSPHIIWTRPIKLGGQYGGEFGGTQLTQFVSTSQYQPLYGPIVIAGRLYWQERPGSSTNPTGWNCVDIKTGELIWHKNTTDPLLCGQILDYQSINQYGGYAYLWSQGTTVAPNTGGTLKMYDAWSGNWICDIVNATGAGAFGAGLNLMLDMRTCKGSLLGYWVDSLAGTFSMWNSTACILAGAPGFTGLPSGNKFGQGWSPPQGRQIGFKWGIEWTAPIPKNFTGTYPSGRTLDLSIITTSPDVIVLEDMSGALFSPQWGWAVDVGMSARDGRVLWGPFNRTLTPFTYVDNFGVCSGSGVYVSYNRDIFEWTGFSMTTGDKLWGPIVPPHNVWDKYGMARCIGYGNLYAMGFGGYVNCIDLQTGTIKWTYYTGGSGYDTPYGVWTIWTFSRQTLADGKLYFGEGHEYSPPLFRGAQEICLDAFTGKQLWSVLGFYAEGPPTIADGVMVVDNSYDMQLYAFSKGQTATTITASPKVAVNGSSILIEGTVTDQSPGQTCLGIPARGTPAIADIYMKPWMEYLYMQQPMPQNATGVGVQLQAVGSDGSTIDIGTVTSDAFGNFEYKWTPTTTGTYKILATFVGSNSYYASYAETSAGVDPAPQAAAPAAEAVAPDYTPMFAGIIVAVAVAIVIGLVNLFWKRK